MTPPHDALPAPPRRAVLLAGMAAFFVVALAVPHAFETTGIAFGAGYVAVNLITASASSSSPDAALCPQSPGCWPATSPVLA